tara:strand:+ start:243 stop:515 length:273 start_codon:yes stop_codon:yes gene_type:complete
MVGTRRNKSEPAGSNTLLEPAKARIASLGNTRDLRDKMLGLWEGYEAGEVKATEARIHIGFCRAVLDTLKVEIATQHLASPPAPVPINRP